MKMIDEFKTFAMKGNVVDMAIGIIIGAAFGKIVTSLVNDIIMPPIGLLIGGVDFTDLKVVLKDASVDEAGKAISAVTLNYGAFIQTTIDFLIVAIAIFMMIKAMNNMIRKRQCPLRLLLLLNQPKKKNYWAEIRDLLKK